MAASCIAHVTVSDEDAYARHARMATETIAAQGGEFLARGAGHRTFEGTDRPRHVVARSLIFEAAEACYLP